MVQISNNGWLSMHRGDSFELPLFISTGECGDNTRFNLKENTPNRVYLGVMEPNQPFECALIRKKYEVFGDEQRDPPMTEDGDLIISFKPTDTEFVSPGKYFYEIKLEHNDGAVDTIVPRTEFFMME